jgi:hypothetical protein
MHSYIQTGDYLRAFLPRGSQRRRHRELCQSHWIVSPNVFLEPMHNRLTLTVHHSSEECLGIHLGDPQSANLGDGNGPVNQTIELRQDFGDPDLGTCLESLIGGNHFRLV